MTHFQNSTVTFSRQIMTHFKNSYITFSNETMAHFQNSYVVFSHEIMTHFHLIIFEFSRLWCCTKSEYKLQARVVRPSCEIWSPYASAVGMILSKCRKCIMASWSHLFVMDPGGELTIGVKFEVNVKQWNRRSFFSCLLYIRKNL